MRLRARLSLFFFAVTALASTSTFVLVRSSTENVFRSFIFTGDAEKAKVYAAILGDWYRESGSWEGSQAFLVSLPALVSRSLDSTIHGGAAQAPLSGISAEALKTLMADRIAVADGNGIIVADTSGRLLGSTHPERHLVHGLPVMSDFRKVGTVLVGSMVDSSLGGVGERYLASVASSLLWSTAASAALALVLGLLLASRITRPLAGLAAAAHRVAAGDLSPAPPVAGGDEVADLSRSFAAMLAELRRLDEAKKRVIADAAHELRTPVTLIQGTVEAMMDGIYPMNAASLASVHEETLRLARLIESLRELELIESGELVLDPEDLDLREEAAKAIALFSAAAGSRSQALVLEGGEGGACTVRADRLRLGELLYNLLSNALKHAPEGGTVLLRLPQGPGDLGARDLVSFSVEDSGPGIPEHERERVFERFYRLDPSRSTDSGGRGLGLSIAREIAKAHGGSIWATSSDLGGASLVVSLPLSPASAPRP
jgi:two-component system OmpR family sensor kinase/two-component system sensor histidine kinase BaeS